MAISCNALDVINSCKIKCDTCQPKRVLVKTAYIMLLNTTRWRTNFAKKPTCQPLYNNKNRKTALHLEIKAACCDFLSVMEFETISVMQVENQLINIPRHQQREIQSSIKHLANPATVSQRPQYEETERGTLRGTQRSFVYQ